VACSGVNFTLIVIIIIIIIIIIQYIGTVFSFDPHKASTTYGRPGSSVYDQYIIVSAWNVVCVGPITGEQSMAANSNDNTINGLLLEPGFYVRAKIVEVFLS